MSVREQVIKKLTERIAMLENWKEYTPWVDEQILLEKLAENYRQQIKSMSI